MRKWQDMTLLVVNGRNKSGYIFAGQVRVCGFNFLPERKERKQFRVDFFLPSMPQYTYARDMEDVEQVVMEAMSTFVKKLYGEPPLPGK